MFTVKSFVVEPVLDDIMAKIGAPNTCHLFIADTEIRLVSAQDGSQLIAWPFTCLRRYMSSRGKFSLEAGRRAPTGEGKFTFITSQHDEIYKLLDNVIKFRAGSITSAPISKPSHLPMQEPIQNDDSYDHLMSSPMKGVAPVHTVHPNYNQNIMVSPLKSDKQSNSNDYASPYGHMKNHESTTSSNAEVMQQTGDIVTNPRNSKIQNDNGYDLLNPTMPTRNPPPPPMSNESTGENTGDFYNTISNQMTDKEEEFYDKLDHSYEDDTYDSLDHQMGSVTKPGRHSTSSEQETFDGDTYNILEHVGTPVSSPLPSKGVKVDEYSTLDRASSNMGAPIGSPALRDMGIDEYSTLDRPPHPPLRQTKSFPIPPPKVSSTASEPRLSQGFDRSSISSPSSYGSSDFACSDSHLSLPTDDQDFYASIDNKVTSKQTSLKPLPKSRQKDVDEDRNRNSVVSNLRASLIADGLNLSKITPNKLGLRRCSVETIEESDTYDQINEGVTQNQKKVTNKLIRSPSAPTEPEDIYEDPEISSHQSKPKVPGNKPAKPRKKKS